MKKAIPMNTLYLNSFKLISANLLRDDYPNALYAFNYALISALQKMGLRREEIQRNKIDPKTLRKALELTREQYTVQTFYEYIFENKAGWEKDEQAARKASALQEIEARPQIIQELNVCVSILNKSDNIKEIDLAYTKALRLCKPESNCYLLVSKNVDGEVPELCSFRKESPAKPGTLAKPTWPVFKKQTPTR